MKSANLICCEILVKYCVKADAGLSLSAARASSVTAAPLAAARNMGHDTALGRVVPDDVRALT